MEIDFYAHLRDTEVTYDTVQSSANDYDINSYTQTITSTETPRTEVVNHSHHTQKQADEWSQIIGTYKTKLNEITDDLILRLQKGDQNVTSGVSKFISMYTKLIALHQLSDMHYTCLQRKTVSILYTVYMYTIVTILNHALHIEGIE